MRFFISTLGELFWPPFFFLKLREFFFPLVGITMVFLGDFYSHFLGAIFFFFSLFFLIIQQQKYTAICTYFCTGNLFLSQKQTCQIKFGLLFD